MKPSTGPFSRQVAIAIGVAAAAGCVAFSAVALSAASTVDGEALDRDRRLLVQGFEELKDDLPRNQQIVTGWDEAYKRVTAGDMDWTHVELGRWLHDFSGVDRAFVLSGTDVPLYAMDEGQRVEARRWFEIEDSAAPLVRKVRSELFSAQKPEDVAATDLVMDGDRLAILSAKAVIPFTEPSLRAPGREPVHIALRYVDETMLAKMAEKYVLPHVAFTTDESPSTLRGAFPVADSKGHMLGNIVWERRNPGIDVLLGMAPALVAATLGIGTLLSALYLRLQRAARRLQQSEEVAWHAARHDALTGLPNRELLSEKLNDLLRDGPMAGRGFSLLCLDLDRFKQVNDTLGYLAADDLLRQAARRIGDHLLPGEMVARVGGNEFSVLIPHGAQRHPELLGRLLVAAVCGPYVVLGASAFVGASVGLIRVTEGLVENEVLRRADVALREAKARGRGIVVAYERELDGVSAAKGQMEADLVRALEDGSAVSVAYQPVHDREGTIVGAEALLRWDDPARGRVPPSEFVPLAEERGLIIKLGELVLEDACETLRAVELPWVSLNVSPIQLQWGGYAESVLATLARTDTDPRRIHVEIAEHTLLDSMPTVIEGLVRLRSAGVRVVLDGFGTTFSPVHRLSRYSLDKIKVSCRFVQAAGGEGPSAAILRAMLDLASALDIPVTAVGIETRAHLEALSSMQCAEFQGFLLSEPLDREGLARRMAGVPERASLRIATSR